MDKFLTKLERKFGKYAIVNLPLWMIVLYAAGYILFWIKPEVISYLSLNISEILHGQVWRLFTWIMVPEIQGNVFFVVLSLYFFYVIGRGLERVWGSFLLNLYIFTGFFFIALGVIVCAVVSAVMFYFNLVPVELFALFYAGDFSGAYYIEMSMFLAYAIMYPDARFLIMFIFPIKAKVLGIIYVIVLAFSSLIQFTYSIEYGIVSLLAVSMSLLNVMVFFLTTQKKRCRSPKEIKRQREYKVKIKKATAVSRHKCAICGQTPESNPQLQFRYCSKCEGNYEYCSEHLFTHEHVKK